jgi:hypothetical protein
MRHAGEAQGVGHHHVVFKNGGHQAGLVVNQHELAIIGV